MNIEKLQPGDYAIREKMKLALEVIDDLPRYEANKLYFKCMLPVTPNDHCGHVGTLGDVLVHMSRHWDVTLGQCSSCLANLYDPSDIYNHKQPNRPDTCKRASHSHHTPSRYTAIMQWKARNLFIKQISKQEYTAWKTMFEKNKRKGHSRPPTPNYTDQIDNDEQAAPEQTYRHRGAASMSTAAFIQQQQMRQHNGQQSQQSSSSGYSTPSTGPPGISQRPADPRVPITTAQSEIRSQIPTSSTPMGTFNGSFGQNSHPASSQLLMDPRNWNTPAPTPQTMLLTTPSYSTQQYPSASAPQFRMMFNSSHNPMQQINPLQQTNPLQQIPLPSSVPTPVPPPQGSHGGGRSRADRNGRESNGPTTSSRFDIDEETAQWRQAQGLAPLPSQPTRGGRRPSVGRDEFPEQQPPTSQRVAQGTAQPPPQNIRRRQLSRGRDASPDQQPPTSQPGARGIAQQPPQSSRVRRPSVGRAVSPVQQAQTSQRVAQETTQPPPQNIRKRQPSRGRDEYPVQQPPTSQRVAQGTAQPPPQNIRRRQPSVGRESVDEIALQSGLTRSRPSRCPTPARETSPEPKTEQTVDASGKITLAIAKPDEWRRQRRSSVSYRSTSRGRSSSRNRDDETSRADMERLQKERELERSKGSKTVKVPPSNNRQFLLCGPSMASNPPPANPPPKISKSDRLRQKLAMSNGLASNPSLPSNPQFGNASQQPSTSNAYNPRGNQQPSTSNGYYQRGNQQPSTSNANNQRYNQGPSAVPPPDSFHPVSSRTRAASRGRSPSPSRSRSRSPSPFSVADQNRNNGNRRSASRGNHQGNRGNNQSSRRNDNYRQDNNYNRNYRRN